MDNKEVKSIQVNIVKWDETIHQKVYRRVFLRLTEEQMSMLRLEEGEFYGMAKLAGPECMGAFAEKVLKVIDTVQENGIANKSLVRYQCDQLKIRGRGFAGAIEELVKAGIISDDDVLLRRIYG